MKYEIVEKQQEGDIWYEVKRNDSTVIEKGYRYLVHKFTSILAAETWIEKDKSGYFDLKEKVVKTIEI